MDKRVKKIVSPLAEKTSKLTVIFQLKDERVSFPFSISEKFFDMSNSEHSTFENLLVNGLAFDNKLKGIQFYFIEVERYNPKALF